MAKINTATKIPQPLPKQLIAGAGTNPKKHLILSDSEVSPFLSLPESSRNMTSKLRWAELDYRLTGKVLHYLKTPGKKDHLQLRSDITSAAIARDKAYSTLQEGPKLHLPTPIIQQICKALNITVQVQALGPVPVTPADTDARAVTPSLSSSLDQKEADASDASDNSDVSDVS